MSKNAKYLKEALQFQIEIGIEDVFSENSEELLEDIEKSKKITEISYSPGQKNDSGNKNIMEEKKPSNFSKPNSISPNKIDRPKSKEIRDHEEWVELAKDLSNKSKNLEELRNKVEEFEGISIKKLAKNTVFAEGNPNSEVMLIGEAPGANEDEKGVPFCGVSGKLLDKIMFYAGYERKNNFYITNTMFWRPPGNRKPLPEELEICRPFVEKHIALINPKVIVLVGGTATFSILGTKDSVTRLRGGKHKYYNHYLDREIDCFAIFHPSYLLRQPSQKKNAWFDILKIKKYIENS